MNDSVRATNYSVIDSFGEIKIPMPRCYYGNNSYCTDGSKTSSKKEYGTDFMYLLPVRGNSRVGSSTNKLIVLVMIFLF